MNCRIRKMLPEDLPEAMELLDRWSMAPTPDIANAERSGIEINHAFVAVDDQGRLVGVGSYLLHSDEVAETASLAVSPEVRGAGVGARLQVARLQEMLARGVRRVRTETDRPETIAWYQRKFGYRIIGSNPKKHAFSLPDVDTWTVLELDLEQWAHNRKGNR
jgi:N-acetylglutamate synthase-like GNAT family acetyltransferase